MMKLLKIIMEYPIPIFLNQFLRIHINKKCILLRKDKFNLSNKALLLVIF